MGMLTSDEYQSRARTFRNSCSQLDQVGDVEITPGEQRRPSFPQGGLDWRLRKKGQGQGHDRRDELRFKNVSVCELPETDEEDDGPSPERMQTHESSCPLYNPNAGSSDGTRKEQDNSDSRTNKADTSTTNKARSDPLPSLLQLPSLPSHQAKPQCNCSYRGPRKSRNNNNNEDQSHGSGDGGRAGVGKRKRKRKSRRETVIINVGGQVFETYRSTLRRLRTPIFDNDAKMQLYYRKAHGDYFFDRDATAFGSILNFLRTGELHIPTNMCGPALQNELEFWGIEEVDIARCCWTQYNTWKTQCRSLEKLEYDRKFSTTQQQIHTVDPNSSCWVRFRTRIWTFLQDPGSSKKAKAYAWVSIIFVFISIFSFCAETHPLFRVKAKDMTHWASVYEFFNLESIPWSKLTDKHDVAATSNNTLNNATILGNSTIDTGSGVSKRHARMYDYDNSYHDDEYGGDYSEGDDDDNTDWGEKDLPHLALLMMDLSCLIFFTLEYLTRFLCSPNKLNFLRALQNIVDFLAFAPDYVELLFLIIDPSQNQGMAIMEMLFILRILRLFRIFRLIRHVPGLWILLYTLKASFNELMLMCVFLLIGMVVFATLIHFVEPDGIFNNIPVGFWWSVVTMTTVGYGDMYPESAAGYFIGSCCAVAGLLMIAFTVPIIVSNFVLYYTHVQYGLARKDRELERMKEEEETSDLARSRSFLDIERAGSTATINPSPTLQPSTTTTRNGKSYTYVNTASEFEAPTCGTPLNRPRGVALALEGNPTSIEMEDRVANRKNLGNSQTVVMLDGSQIA